MCDWTRILRSVISSHAAFDSSWVSRRGCRLHNSRAQHRQDDNNQDVGVTFSDDVIDQEFR